MPRARGFGEGIVRGIEGLLLCHTLVLDEGLGLGHNLGLGLDHALGLRLELAEELRPAVSPKRKMVVACRSSGRDLCSGEPKEIRLKSGITVVLAGA